MCHHCPANLFFPLKKKKKVKGVREDVYQHYSSCLGATIEEPGYGPMVDPLPSTYQ